MLFWEKVPRVGADWNGWRLGWMNWFRTISSNLFGIKISKINDLYKSLSYSWVAFKNTHYIKVMNVS